MNSGHLLFLLCFVSFLSAAPLRQWRSFCQESFDEIDRSSDFLQDKQLTSCRDSEPADAQDGYHFSENDPAALQVACTYMAPPPTTGCRKNATSTDKSPSTRMPVDAD